MTRCTWARHPLEIDYHDHEWGLPCRDAKRLFEFLILEGAQAGLSWLTVLKKREAYRQALDNFNPDTIARFGPGDIQRLMQNADIIRNRLKIESTVSNARAWIELSERADPVETLWQFVDGQPLQNHWRQHGDIPAQTPESRQMSRELKRLGFRFVGPTICYAYMQAVGMVNDHTTDCFRHRECQSASL